MRHVSVHYQFFFLFFNLSHSLLLCNIACVCSCVCVCVGVHTLYQNTFQPHGPRLILPEVYSIIIFSTRTVYTHSPLPPPAILPVQFVGEYCTLSGGAWMTLASFAVLFYWHPKKKIRWDTIRASSSKTNTRRKNNNNNNNNNREERTPHNVIIISIVCRATRRPRFLRDPVCHCFRMHVYLL